MIKIAVIGTKGGIGKTTLSLNIGCLLADMGLNVLLVDTDEKPSLSKALPIKQQAPHALSHALVQGAVTSDCISEISLEGAPGAIDIVCSDSPETGLVNWLTARTGRVVRLKTALQCPDVRDNYDIVIIDTHGGDGVVQDAACIAADLILTPVKPDVLSAAEFVDGTLAMITELEEANHPVGTVKGVINCLRRSNNSRDIADVVRQNFIKSGGRVSILETTIPDLDIYQATLTEKRPVHRPPDPKIRKTPVSRREIESTLKASQTMHALIWELIPSLKGVYAGGIQDDGPPESGDGAALDGDGQSPEGAGQP